MEQKKCLELLNIMSTIYETPDVMDEYWEQVTPLLKALTAAAPQGLEGTAMMISTHFTNAAKFKDVKVQKFELESGLIKLKTYFQKLNSSVME
ncbi:hypothetical protein [Psychromonas aquimarina]|uniref:hypothetical protein n=1 Tax=Psychromonas aquimarina TaxID=444919 RepID=UPI0004226ADF|nr:hypothetical protein [Psychromonas aquimarina]